MTDTGIPELEITPARSKELMLINRALIKKSLCLWNYLLELEELGGVTEREKLAMAVGTSYSVALCSTDKEILAFNKMPILGLS